ncbi:MAG: Luc7-like protein 3 [Paramarteilia canceri]
MFLCGFCPHELFVNTRADLGVCSQVHQEELRQAYINSSDYQRLGYEIDFAAKLRKLIREFDTSIKKRHEKLLHQSNIEATSAAAAPLLEKINNLQELIDQKSKLAEDLGNEGNIEEACEVMKQIEKIESEKQQQERVIRSLQTEAEKKQRVCEICGANLVVGDGQHRLDEHMKGKLHSGSYRIRQYLKEFDKIEPKLIEIYDSAKNKKSYSSYRRHESRHKDIRRNKSLEKSSRKSNKEAFNEDSLEAGELRQSSSLERELKTKHRHSSERYRNREEKSYHRSHGRRSRERSPFRRSTSRSRQKNNHSRHSPHKSDRHKSYDRRSSHHSQERYSEKRSKHSEAERDKSSKSHRESRKRSRSKTKKEKRVDNNAQKTKVKIEKVSKTSDKSKHQSNSTSTTDDIKLSRKSPKENKGDNTNQFSQKKEKNIYDNYDSFSKPLINGKSDHISNTSEEYKLKKKGNETPDNDKGAINMMDSS